MSDFIVCVEFPDEDQKAYELYDKGLMQGQVRTFSTFEAAEKYAKEKYGDFVYNIVEINKKVDDD